jgi:hypothetical protein
MKRKKLGGHMDVDGVIRYASSCMSFKSREKEHSRAQHA